jgi:hypothetical protein
MAALKLVSVHIGEPQPARKHRLQLHLLPDRLTQQLGHFPRDPVDVEHHRRQWLLARERQQPAGQRRRAAGGLQGILHQAAAGRIGTLALQPQVQPADDHRQHIVEIVRDPADELAERLHLLRLPQLQLGALSVGDFFPQRLHRGLQARHMLVPAAEYEGHQQSRTKQRQEGRGQQ